MDTWCLITSVILLHVKFFFVYIHVILWNHVPFEPLAIRLAFTLTVNHESHFFLIIQRKLCFVYSNIFKKIVMKYYISFRVYMFKKFFYRSSGDIYQKRELVNPNVVIRQYAKDENGNISCSFLWPNLTRSMISGGPISVSLYSLLIFHLFFLTMLEAKDFDSEFHLQAYIWVATRWFQNLFESWNNLYIMA